MTQTLAQQGSILFSSAPATTTNVLFILRYSLRRRRREDRQ